MIHSAFNLAYYIEQYPIDRLRLEAVNDLLKPLGESIYDPRCMAIVEQLRGEGLAGKLQPASIGTDVFVPMEGEPENRAVTKVGGCPYWPKDKPIPYKDGSPLTFVAQVCFADSRDIVAETPGDILLIFGDEEALSDDCDDQSALQFYWTGLTDLELVPTPIAPRSFWEIAPHYGVRHRTSDYLDDVPEFGQYMRDYLLSQIEGTKIGGIPRWVQYDPQLPGKFLASVSGIEWDDGGVLYLNIEENGAIYWTIQGY